MISLCSFLFASVWFVIPGGTGSGESWESPASVETAFTSVADNDEIWLKKGEYNLTSTLVTDKAVSVLGGFEGTETAANQRAGGDVRSVLNGSSVSGSSCVEATCDKGAGYTVSFDSVAFRGGKYRGLYKHGFSNTEIKNCEFSGNGHELTGSSSVFLKGRGAYVLSSDYAATCDVSASVFSNNLIKTHNTYGGSDAGAGLCIEHHHRASLTDSKFIGNGLPKSETNNAPGRDRNTFGGGFCAWATGVGITNCVFVGNRIVGNGSGDGGSAIGMVWEGVNASAGLVNSSLSHCLIYGNETCRYSSGSSAIAGALSLGTIEGSSIDIDHCTIAYNIAPRGQCAGLLVRSEGRVYVRNSIIYGNIAEASVVQGCDIYAQNWCTKTYVTNSLIGGLSAPYVAKNINNNAVLEFTDCITGDPLFATGTDAVAAMIDPASRTPYNADNSTGKMAFIDDAWQVEKAIDLHLKSMKGRWTPSGWVQDAVVSPALDAATEDDDYSLEPEPNGGRANLGYYGGTAQASKNKVAVPVIESVSVALKSDDYTRPYVSFAMASDEDSYLASVYFCYGDEQSEEAGIEGWDTVIKLADGVMPGQSFVELPADRYISKGTKYWRVAVIAGANTVTADGQLQVAADYPPQWGHGGGNGVIHVWAGGQGSKGGTSWLDACATLAEAFALIDDSHTNIWVAGTVFSAAKGLTTTRAITVVGGFTGTEDSLAERVNGAKSTIDGDKLNGGMKFDPAAGYTAAYSRIDSLIFTNMYQRTIDIKTRSNYDIVNCVFDHCGYSDQNEDGDVLYVEASATDTQLNISNCVFRNCYKGLAGTTDGYQNRYSVAKIVTAKHTKMTDCEFVNSGIARTSDWNSSRGRELTNIGFVLDATTPIEFIRCRFLGNCGTSHKTTHALVRLAGASAGTSFVNCEFTGNQSQQYSNTGAGTFDQQGTVLLFAGANASDEFTFDNCTFAYNMVEGAKAPVFQVDKGAVKVKNSIVFGNACITNQSNGAVMEATAAYVKTSDGTIAFDYCMLDNREDYPAVCFGAGVNHGNATMSNCLMADPLFVSDCETVLSHVRNHYYWGGNSTFMCRYVITGGNAAAAEYTAGLDTRLRGHYGFDDFVTGELIRFRKVKSPAIDAGDPASPYALEPKKNGGRVNLGNWGNTPWATRSDGPGMMVILR